MVKQPPTPATVDIAIVLLDQGAHTVRSIANVTAGRWADKTIRAHLHELVRVGVTHEKRGRTVIYRWNTTPSTRLPRRYLDYLNDLIGEAQVARHSGMFTDHVIDQTDRLVAVLTAIHNGDPMPADLAG